MTYNGRSDQILKTELEYVQEYVGRVFGKQLEKDEFSEKLNEIINQKIAYYIFQRYRDWTAPELARLRDAWGKPEQVDQPMTSEVTAPRRGRPPKSISL